MPRNVNSVLHASNPRKKRQMQPVSHSKKLRSKIPRRKRIPHFPILSRSSNELFSSKESELSAFPAPSCSSSCFTGDVSCDSSMISVGSVNPKKRQRSKESDAIERSGVAFFGKDSRPITRSYYRLKENVRSEENKGSPTVGSFSPPKGRDVIRSAEVSERNLKQTIGSVKRAPKSEKSEEISCIEPFLPENPNLKAGSCKGDENSLQSLAIAASAASGAEFSEISCIESLSAANTRNAAKTEPSVVVSEQTVDLTCSEQLSDGDDSSDYSSCQEMTLSQLEAEIFPKNSDGECVEFSQPSLSSILGESSVDSETSGCNSTPSVCFSLFLQYTKQLSRSRSRLKFGTSDGIEDEYSDKFTLLRFENEEHEESYKKLRIRERRHEYRHNYIEVYGLTTEYGDVVLQQRLLMVNWIIEHADEHELHYETLFLSVSLFDRFLGKGFFKSKRKLQLLGIACCTLATRIEENQPLNCIRRKEFLVGTNVFSRCEVVAMEWLVQEVLSFQCYLPTIYNFLWFYLSAAKADAEVEGRAKYLAVLSLLDHESLCFWPSTVAASLVILASLAANRDSSCQWVMETHVRTGNDDLPECIRGLEWLVKYVC
ncbi:cyclin-SDS-like [Magnolia sinica]|uniref:cyclin-SDS-like n=1 Tax=Magnolia sinica TaxID=86752 RepID=UPI00265A586F|nr:cyclin-SDS-like [Magnolia sinica]